jgi:hypothetical protein
MNTSNFPFRYAQMISACAVSILLSACGDGVLLDTKAVSNTFEGRNPVGLIEVKGTNPDNGAMGISLDAKQSRTWENKYCSAFLLSSGQVLTGGDCITQKDSMAKMDPGAMTLYMRLPGDQAHTQYRIKSITTSKIDADANNWAVLELDNGAALVEKYGALDLGEMPSIDTLSSDFPVTVVNVNPPAGHAKIAEATVGSAVIAGSDLYKRYQEKVQKEMGSKLGFLPNQDKKDVKDSKDESDSSNIASESAAPSVPATSDSTLPVNGNPGDIATAVRAATVARIQKDLAQPRFLTAHSVSREVKASNGVMIYQGKVIGLLQPKADKGKTRMQWLQGLPVRTK